MQYAETLPLSGSRGGADVRRRTAAAQQQSDPGHSRRAMHQGDLLHDRPHGAKPIRKASASCATPATPSAPTARTIRSTMNKMPIERARQEIDDGIASVKAALGDDADSRWRRSSAFPACCAPKPSRTISPRRASRSGAPISRPTTGGIFRRRGSTISRSSGSRPRARASCCCTTSRRAPSPRCRGSCSELKARGYRIVHVVPATPDRPATPTEPQQWQLHPPSENRGDLALAQDSEFRLRRCRHACRRRRCRISTGVTEALPLPEPFDRPGPRGRAAPRTFWPCHLPAGHTPQ